MRCIFGLLIQVVQISANLPILVSVPARPFCTDAHAYIDNELNVCVKIDRNQKQTPIYADCPGGLELEGRNCIGILKSELELTCPALYDLNWQQQCIRAEAYAPPGLICPEGFTLHRGTHSKPRLCLKKNQEEPHLIISDPTFSNCAKETCKTLTCSTGFKLVQRRKKKNYSTKKNGWICESTISVTPVGSDCNDNFAWSDQLNGCLRLREIQPGKQCPNANAKIGVGHGDWETPTFRYDTTEKICIATWAPAIRPQCLPGWALEGNMNHICHKKIFSSIHYDCANAEGFTFRWNDTTAICEFEDVIRYDTKMTNGPQKISSRFSQGPDYLTTRSIKSGKQALRSATPWAIIDGYEQSEELSQADEKFGIFGPALIEKTGQDTIEGESEFTNARWHSNKEPQATTEINSDMSYYIDYESINSLPLPAQFVSEPVSNLEGTEFAFFSSRPQYRGDLLGPRDPGETGPTFSTPDRSRFNWMPSRGIF